MALSLPHLVRDYAEIDLTRMGVDSRITFTRASTRTYYGADGLMRTAAINEWPLEYDPATGACLGRSTWLQRSNLLTYSGIETGVAGMTAGNVSDASIAWLGALSAGISFGDNTTTRFAYRVNFLNQIGVVYMLSVFVRMDDGGVPVFGGTGPTNDGGLVIGGQIVTSVTAQHVGGGIYRLSGSRSHTAANSANGVIKYTSNSARGFKVSGYQLEAASTVSPYIPTTTVAVTRSTDAAVINDLGTLQFNPSEGTLITRATSSDVVAVANNRVLWALTDGTAGNRIQAFLNPNVGIQQHLRVDSAGVTQVNAVTANAVTAMTEYKTAVAYQLNNYGFVLNGGTVVTDAAATVPVVNRLRVASRFDGNELLSGWMKSLRYYPRRLSNAELQALTA